jgi:predicted transposase
MQRTMRLKLHPMPEQAHTLTATLAQFTDAFNWVCAYGWEHNEKNGVRLHHAMYYPVKKVCSGLVSDLVIQTRVKATEALQSAFAQRKVSCPRSQRCAARYNVYIYALQWEEAAVWLSTVKGSDGCMPGALYSSGSLWYTRQKKRAWT